MKKLSPIKAIRAHCIDCSGGSLKDVRNCVITDCPLYSYREGKNSSRKGIGKPIAEILHSNENENIMEGHNE